MAASKVACALCAYFLSEVGSDARSRISASCARRNALLAIAFLTCGSELTFEALTHLIASARRLAAVRATRLSAADMIKAGTH